MKSVCYDPAMCLGCDMMVAFLSEPLAPAAPAKKQGGLSGNGTGRSFDFDLTHSLVPA